MSATTDSAIRAANDALDFLHDLDAVIDEGERQRDERIAAKVEALLESAARPFLAHDFFHGDDCIGAGGICEGLIRRDQLFSPLYGATDNDIDAIEYMRSVGVEPTIRCSYVQDCDINDEQFMRDWAESGGTLEPEPERFVTITTLPERAIRLTDIVA